MGRLRLCFFAALIASCDRGVGHEFVPLPDLGSSRALILAADEQNDRGLRLMAADRSDRLEVPVSDGVTLHLLAYDSSLEELGLSPGPLDPSLSREHCARLHPQLVFAASGATDALAWTATQLPLSLHERLIDSPERTCGPCREFDQEDLPLPGTGWPTFALSSGPDVLVGLSTGALVRITADGQIVELCTLPSPLRSGAFRESDQSFVVGLDDGRLFRVLELASPVCSVEQLGAVDGIPARVGLSQSGPLVAYVLSDRSGDALLWRVDTSSTAMLHQHTLDPEFVRPDQRGYRGGVAWLGPEHVLFVAGDNGIYRLRDGTVTVERLDLEDILYRVQSLAATPFGPIVGVEPWGIAAYDQSNWLITDQDSTWCHITALLPYEDVVLIGQRGTLEFFEPENRAYCPRFTYELAQGEPQSMAKLGASDVIVADRPPGEGSLPKVRRLFRKDL